MKAALAALALVVLAACARAAPEKRDIHLLTSLPLLFGEQFSLETEAPPIVAHLERRFRLTAVDLPSQLPPNATLLMVQPRALPAEELVALDRWVRSGGRLLLLADPRLEWPSERPLGDPLRPPPMFPDTGLLAHWGLTLDLPDAPGPAERGGVRYISPGALIAANRQCAVTTQTVARCRLGSGRAIVVADADWLSRDLAGTAFDANAAQLDSLIDSLAR
ncbi:DUF4350 domain-containing protein [Sphingomonas mesophila]|uniref:DUF4350 domain-containing protein n=1 Tax=Sphingomonas mesophila TaxID=2303576 RepID=UPI000E58B7B9|nr:DUF4350 domain-containing protein [Sphingomonas mesophila]